ncbi:unnamed protein product [Schistosoma margrebowiei]|uniref:Uncharacterized protein n=1 Tax=Schistosoma margrebowiei TaxID=48269 RepID=A0A3P8BJR0_9TREM|nr:unnamed protein product [Schistosoma margrebowiei]
MAIARCLASMLPIDQGKNRLLVTGLLSQDNRFAERKQPGQRKARKKPICVFVNRKLQRSTERQENMQDFKCLHFLTPQSEVLTLVVLFSCNLNA